MSLKRENLLQSDFDRGVSPAWAQLLYKGVGKRNKLSDASRAIKSDPSLLLKGYFGKSLLDKHVNPFLEKVLPDSVKLDVLKQKLKFSPSRKLDMTLGKRKFGLNWRF